MIIYKIILFLFIIHVFIQHCLLHYIVYIILTVICYFKHFKNEIFMRNLSLTSCKNHIFQNTLELYLNKKGFYILLLTFSGI